MGNKLIKLKQNSVRVAIGTFSILFLMFALNLFDVIIPGVDNGLVLSIAAILIIIFEVGIVNLFGKGREAKLDIFNVIGLGAALVLLATISLDLLSISVPALDGVRGFVIAIVGLSFAVETFTR